MDLNDYGIIGVGSERERGERVKNGGLLELHNKKSRVASKPVAFLPDD